MEQITAADEVLEYGNGTDLVVFDTATRATHLLEAPTSLVYQIIRKNNRISEKLILEACQTAGIAITEVELESVLDSLSKVTLIERTT